MLDNRYALLFIRGERAIMDEKIDILRHPNVRGTADGKAGPYIHGAVTLSVATLAYQENADLSKLPEPAVPEGDYELLSEEDMEERYAQNTRKGESAEENESHLNGDPSSIIARKNKKNENKGGNIYHDAV